MAEIQKTLNIDNFFNLLHQEIIPNIENNDARLYLWRFMDKISDSDKFAQKTHEVFNQKKMGQAYEKINQISKREVIQLVIPEFKLVPKEQSWTLYFNDEVWLTDLDNKLAKKVIIDINAAYAIKATRLQRGKLD